MCPVQGGSDDPSAELEPNHREGMLRAVKACLIHNTLLNAPAIDVLVTAADRPLATSLK